MSFALGVVVGAVVVWLVAKFKPAWLFLGVVDITINTTTPAP